MLGFVGRFTAFFDELDDWCGTKPPRHFPPRPGALRDILLSEVIYEAAGRVSNQKIQGQLQSLATDLQAAGARGLVG
jgi:hypothetical protein